MNHGKVNRTFKSGLFLFVIIGLISCNQDNKEDNTIDAIIPKPQTVTSSGKNFVIAASTGIVIEPGSEELKSIANYLAGKLKPSTGYAIPVSAVASINQQQEIF